MPPHIVIVVGALQLVKGVILAFAVAVVVWMIWSARKEERRHALAVRSKYDEGDANE